MKIAVISDIHGNYDALEVVLKKARAEGVKHLLVLGDIVGYYYHPDKILSALFEWSYDLIKGNHEYMLEDLMKDASIGESIRLKYGSGHQEAIDKLSKEQLQFLKTLPDTKTVKLDDATILMCHGSPWSNDFYIYPDADNETLLKCDSSIHDFVLIGHSHYQFAVRNKSSMLVNPGSVGQSRQHGGLADWCIINTENKCFQMLSTPYSTEKLITEIATKDKDIDYLNKILKRS